jgi:PAS domain S-box-containing protein
MSGLHKIGGDIEGALERVNVPAYVIDAAGVIRWINAAALKLVGDVRGRQFTSVVAPEDRRRSQELFAQKVLGTASVTDADVVVLDAHGDRLEIEVSSTPLMSGHRVVGVFGQVLHRTAEAPPAHPALTPRQADVLHLLEHGRSTRQIAEELHLSPLTVRNHISALLKALGVHSRLEAVAIARHTPAVAK